MELVRLHTTLESFIPTNYRFRSGIPQLDEAMDGGIPARQTMLLLNDPENDVSTFAQQFCWQGLRDGEVVVYFSYDQHPDAVRANMLRFKWNTSLCEEIGNFIIVDCYSARIGERGKEEYWLERPFEILKLFELFRTLEREIRLTKPECPVRVVLDSFSSFVHIANFTDTVKLVLKLQGLAKRGPYVGLGVVHKGIHGTANEFIAKHVSDGIIEMYTREESRNLQQYLRVSKMRLTEFRSIELPYILEEDGIKIIQNKRALA